jgi:hypothetical protein
VVLGHRFREQLEPQSGTAYRFNPAVLTEAGLLRLVTIDLSQADLHVFERYEASVLALLPKHRGRLELRVRALDGQTETHLLYFPDEQAFDAFRSDPARLVLADEWKRCGALSTVQLVERIAEG